jgi:hypothetical protein
LAELKWLESYLNIVTIKCAVQSDIIDRGVKEYRWFLKHGMERNTLQELSPQFFENRDNILASTDQELAKCLSLLPQQENRASEAPLSITNAVLSAPTSAKLSPAELKKLIDVRWQSTLLNSEARNTNEWLRLTFTVTGDTNHPRVKENHEGCLRMYGLRASCTLDYVRTALSELEKIKDVKS